MSNRLWAWSLIVIGIATVLLVGLPAVGIALPDSAVRILGVIEIVALPVLVMSTVWKLRKK